MRGLALGGSQREDGRIREDREIGEIEASKNELMETVEEDMERDEVSTVVCKF